jgi:hypothetical protein
MFDQYGYICDDKEENTDVKSSPQTHLPYEKKYVEKFQALSSDIILTEKESQLKKEKKQEWENEKRWKEIDQELKELEEKIEIKRNCIQVDDKINILGLTARKMFLQAEKKERERNSQDESFFLKQVLVEKWKKLQNNILLEQTPLGNVLMYYNQPTESFIYYSDHTIPFRYLETVSRKYVVTYHCKALYNEVKEDNEKEDNEKEDNEKEDNEKEDKKKESPAAPAKKEVFAKLKNYALDTTKGTTRQNKQKGMPVLKDIVNRYTHKGKMQDFDMLQRKHKVLPKRRALTFSEWNANQKPKSPIEFCA